MSYFGAIAKGEDPGRAVWVPFLETLAAQVEGCDPGALLADPTVWANALPRVAKLVDAKVIGVGFVDGFGIDSFTADLEEPWRNGPVEALLECVRRLAETVRPDRELVVALPGPAVVLSRGFAEEPNRNALEKVKPGLVKLLETICACRPDLVLIDESAVSTAALASGDYRRICNTLKNVAEYFGTPLGIRVSGCADAASVVRDLRVLRLDHLMLGAGIDQASIADAVAAAEGAGWRSVGVPVASEQAVTQVVGKGTGCYWCSPSQELDLEKARRIGINTLEK